MDDSPTGKCPSVRKHSPGTCTRSKGARNKSSNGFFANAKAKPVEKPLLFKELPSFKIVKGAILYQRFCSFAMGRVAKEMDQMLLA
jgi:hypothetical protein